MGTWLAGLLLMVGMVAAIGFVLLQTARRWPENPTTPAERINALLPQTQCGQCGYPGCRPYAQAIVEGTADIDQCAPGGDALVVALSRLLGRSPAKLDRNYGHPQPLAVARIDEAACIGCALCIAACPTDAILGASRFTHTVIRSECTGCELCVAPCPVDCIVLEPLSDAEVNANLQAAACH
ncbi:MAG: RnfABCDGE type electron transport complex subunit B [Gammaproteobacteria bacterium]|jgi:electron transport complex protein RnfB